MKLLTVLLSVLMLSLMTSCTHADEAIEALAGEWVVETFDGEATDGVEIRITFDDDTMRNTISEDGQVIVEEEMRYEVDADGSITTYPPNQPNPDVGTWEVSDDGKLHLDFPGTGIDGVSMVLRRA